MSMRGRFYPWRVKYAYPNGVTGMEHRLENEQHALRKTAALFWRGADATILSVDPDTREQTVLHELHAADFDFTGIIDGLGDWQTPAEAVYDMLHQRMYGNPSKT
jgi:hypothetical protein